MVCSILKIHVHGYIKLTNKIHLLNSTNQDSSNSNNELLEQQKGLWYHHTLCMFSLIYIFQGQFWIFFKTNFISQIFFPIKTIFDWIPYREGSVDLWSDVGHTITGCSLHRTVWLGLKNVCNGSIQQGHPKFSHLKKISHSFCKIYTRGPCSLKDLTKSCSR